MGVRSVTKEGMKKTWDDRLAEFVRWKEANGHPYVPTVSKDEHKHLGRWVAKQRMAYKNYRAREEGREVKKNKYGFLTAEKALQLANAGFAFDASHVHKTPKAAADAASAGEGGGDGIVKREENENVGHHDEQKAAPSALPNWYGV